jgi:hypothetical protein
MKRIKERKVVRQYVVENNKWRERLVKLVGDITDNELTLIIYKEGWTIAAALGHLAFWDERRLALARRWRRKELTPSNIDGVDMHTVNDALVPFFLAMPPRKLAEFALFAAEKVDKELENLPDDVLPVIAAMDDRHALNRGIHRQMHLDEIEAFLKEKRR